MYDCVLWWLELEDGVSVSYGLGNFYPLNWSNDCILSTLLIRMGINIFNIVLQDNGRCSKALLSSNFNVDMNKWWSLSRGTCHITCKCDIIFMFEVHVLGSFSIRVISRVMTSRFTLHIFRCEIKVPLAKILLWNWVVSIHHEHGDMNWNITWIL